ncbi:hypothetical protein SAMN05216383_10983 [Prevotella sp. KH2C16]|nr:hypothetical protein SAMN05216383_10983 [Prevotella sp. KH2C16]
MFVATLASVLSLASCSSDEIEGVAGNQAAAGKGISINVALKPDSRAVYTDDGTNLKAAFEKDVDYITVFFRNAKTQSMQECKLTCTSVSSAGGTFTSDPSELTADKLKGIMAGGELADLHMILASTKNKPDFYDVFVNDLSTQDGTLEDATAHMQRVTNHDMTVAENYEWDEANALLTLKNVDFNSNPELCTSIIKVKAVFPADAEVVKGETPIDLYGENAYSKYTCGWGNANSPTITNGTVPFTKAKVAELQDNADGTKTAVAYVCFWPTTKNPLGLLEVKSKVGDIDYTGEYTVEHVTMGEAGDATTLKGAKLYTLPITLAPSQTITRWVNDAESTIEVAGATLETSNVNWLTFGGGHIAIEPNATGAPRTGEIDLKADGKMLKYVITQLAPNDFKGTYTFTSKTFQGDGGPYKDSNKMAISGFKFGDPLHGETLKDADDTEYTNQIGITGFYPKAIADATIVIDYENQTVKLGVFLDGRDDKGQPVSTITNFPNIAITPELATAIGSSWGKPWKFNESDLGTPDYTWIWFQGSSDLKTFTYYNNTNQELTQYGSPTMNKIIGINVICSTGDINQANVRAGYVEVYQCNSNLTFTKTANAPAGAKTDASGITATGYTVK